MACSKCNDTGLTDHAIPCWGKTLCDCAASFPMRVFWVVGSRWVIHYGQPEQIVCVRGFQNRERDRATFTSKAFVFDSNEEACKVADSYQSRKSELPIHFS